MRIVTGLSAYLSWPHFTRSTIRRSAFRIYRRLYTLAPTSIQQTQPKQWCQIPSKTNRQTNTSVFPIDCLFVCSVCQRHPSYGWTKRDVS